MCSASTRSIGGNLVDVISDYNPEGGRDASGAIENIVFEAFREHRSRPENLASRVDSLPTMSEVEDAIRNPGIIDLSQILAALRAEDWSPDAIAESLLENEEVRQKFSNKEELIAILHDLKRLDTDLQKIGCSSLDRFLEQLIPQRSEDPDALESGWVDVQNELPRSQPSQSSYVWSFIKGTCRFARQLFKVGQKISEVRGAITSVFALFVLLRDPRTKALISGLKWLVFTVV
ncbi:MAG: hypothetical protein ACE5GN_01765 [Waddliaceae bacterium]